MKIKETIKHERIFKLTSKSTTCYKCTTPSNSENLTARVVPPQINTTEKKNKKTVRKQRTLSFSLKNNTGKSEKMGSLKAVTAQTFPKNQT